MCNIVRKEFCLSASVLSYAFIVFGVMFFLPGYPILCSAFFVTLGIFQSFQKARESNDFEFSALLPIAKKDIVKGKFIFVCFIELCSGILMLAAVLARMTVLSSAAAYRNNALMNANFFALGLSFIIFALFNCIFVRGFFRTAYKFGKPFILYIVLCFTMIIAGEILHYFPGLEVLNSSGFDHIPSQLILLFTCLISFTVITMLAYHKSCRDFEKIDL